MRVKLQIYIHFNFVALIDVDVQNGQCTIIVQFRYQINRIWRICIEDITCLFFLSLLEQHLVPHDCISGLEVGAFFLWHTTYRETIPTSLVLPLIVQGFFRRLFLLYFLSHVNAPPIKVKNLTASLTAFITCKDTKIRGKNLIIL